MCLSLCETGQIAKTIIQGDRDCVGTEDNLRNAVAEFNSSLSLLGHTMTFRTFEELKGRFVGY